MALGKPVLFLGPDPCHVSDLIQDLGTGWHIRHGQVDEAVDVIQQMLNTDSLELAEMGQRARREVENELNMEQLLGKFCDLVEQN